jgi:hypothetical protein
MLSSDRPLCRSIARTNNGTDRSPTAPSSSSRSATSTSAGPPGWRTCPHSCRGSRRPQGPCRISESVGSDPPRSSGSLRSIALRSRSSTRSTRTRVPGSRSRENPQSLFRSRRRRRSRLETRMLQRAPARPRRDRGARLKRSGLGGQPINRQSARRVRTYPACRRNRRRLIPTRPRS